ncbi:MAG: hypothetical protein FWD11_06265, partial [Micrococcales bacterium]|nr:hypothetical protein [Micrococcales bacterium]
MTATLALVGLGVLGGDSAFAANTTLLVNSLGTEAASGSLTDGVCQSTAGTCTLRAAIEESNALNQAPGEVEISLDPALEADIRAGHVDGNIDLSTVATNAGWMFVGNVRQQGPVNGTLGADAGAVFAVTAPVTIDLAGLVSIHPTGSVVTAWPSAAVFYLNGPDIFLTGMKDVYSDETSFYVGANAVDVTVDGMSVSTPNTRPQRFVVIAGGASNVTVSNNYVTGFDESGSAGWGWVDGTSTTYPVASITMVGNTFHANAGGSPTTCVSNVFTANAANGCSSSALNMQNRHVGDLVFSGNTVENLRRLAGTNSRMLDMRNARIGTVTITDNVITNPNVTTNSALIEFGAAGVGAIVDRVTITDNVFSDVTAGNEEMYGVVRLPGNRGITNGGLIARNEFYALDVQTHAIYWQGPFGDIKNTTASGMVIENNYFDGWGDNVNRATIRMYQTGAVTVRHNIFGTDTGSQANTVREENTGTGTYPTTLLSNWSYGANGKMNAWYPTARSATNVQASPVSAVGCVVPLEVAPPSDPTNPTSVAPTLAHFPVPPVTLDVYWTVQDTAEVYVGSYTVTSNARTTLQVALPTDPDDPRLRWLSPTDTVPVDPATGIVSGYLRLQTQDPNINGGATTVSSHYSRVAQIDGVCVPVLTIAQRSGQAEQSQARDRVFRLTSTMPLDPSSVTASIFDLTE